MPEEEFRFESMQPGDAARAGRYELLARIGGGGMGRVYLSFTPGGQPIAVKVLTSDLTQGLGFADRFSREVSIAQQVSGPHVAQLLDADPHAVDPWLASAYVAGPSLQELVASTGPLPPQDVLLLAHGTAQALATIHTAKVIHRDLKPANILLDEGGPKVIDFGIVKSLAATEATHSHATRIGTPAYMSPEQATGKAVTTASDVFSLGATLYFLTTGQLAFEADNALAMAYRVLHDEPELDVLDGRIRQVVEACMVKSPDSRPTPAEVVALCQTLIGAVPPGAYLGIAQAREAIRGRVRALASISPARPEPVPPDLQKTVTFQNPGPVFNPGPIPNPGPNPGPPSQPNPTPPFVSPQPPPAPSRDRSPMSGQILYGVGIGAAIMAVLAGGLLWLANNLSTRSPNDTPTGAPTSVTSQGAGPGPVVDTRTTVETPPTPTDQSPSPSPSPVSDPAQVVNAFYAAINAKNWRAAWRLGGDDLGQSYSAFVQGYGGTASDIITAQDAGATTASIQLTATQNDGSVQQYSGTYTVVNGVITGAHVSRVG